MVLYLHISSYSRLNNLYSLFTPIILSLYVYYSNISHFAWFSDVYTYLHLLATGPAVGRDYIVVSLHC